MFLYCAWHESAPAALHLTAQREASWLESVITSVGRDIDSKITLMDKQLTAIFLQEYKLMKSKWSVTRLIFG